MTWLSSFSEGVVALQFAEMVGSTSQFFRSFDGWEFHKNTGYMKILHVCSSNKAEYFRPEHELSLAINIYSGDWAEWACCMHLIYMKATKPEAFMEFFLIGVHDVYLYCSFLFVCFTFCSGCCISCVVLLVNVYLRWWLFVSIRTPRILCSKHLYH